MQLLWQHRLPLLLLLAYLMVAMGIYLRWERADWYHTTGDEPHHLTIGRSIVHHGRVELTPAYRDEIAEGRLGAIGDEPSSGFFHLQGTQRGLFSIHPIGTGAMAAPAIALSDALGYDNDVLFVKAFFVLLSGSLVLAVWTLASIYLERAGARVLAVVVICFALPPLIAVNQVFPDLPAGILVVCVLAYTAWRQRHATVALWVDVAAMAAIAWLPWLHYKFAVLAVILGIALLFVVYRSPTSRRSLVAVCVVPAIAAALFFAYNQYAFGDPLFTWAPVHSDSRVVQWFFIFNLDRWHGFFIQNPIYIVGLLFLVPFVVRQPVVGLAGLCCYFAAIGINAAHASPGDSFAGRHAWTGCMAMAPVTIYGLGRIESISPRALYAICAGAIAIQALAIIPAVLDRKNLYLQDPASWFDAYHSFYPSFADAFLPAFYNRNWWDDHATNILFVALALAAVVFGTWAFLREQQRPIAATGGFFAIAIVLVVAVGMLQPDPARPPRVFVGSRLPHHFGTVLPNALRATVVDHSAGMWTFGPYVDTAPGDYEIIFEYSADAATGLAVGSWDVTTRAGRITLAKGDLLSSHGLPGKESVRVHIDSRHTGETLEARIYFADVVDVTLDKITVRPVD